MIIAIVSDTHGNIREFVNKVKTINPSYILHLGDYFEDGKAIEESTGIKTYIVKGNNDFMVDKAENELLVKIEDKEFYMTHGHLQNVYFGNEKILERAKNLKVDYGLHGHTHIYYDEEKDGIRIINPGSATYPRGRDKKGFVIVDIDSGKSERILL